MTIPTNSRNQGNTNNGRGISLSHLMMVANMYAAKPQQKTMEPNGDTVLQTGTTSVLSSNAPSGNSGTKPTLSTAVLSTAQSLPPNMAAGANNNMNHATLPQMMVNPDLARVLATAQFSTAAPKALFTPQQAPAPQPAVAPAAPNVDFLALARAVPGLAAIASGLGGSGDSSALELLQSLGLHQITNSLQQPQQQSSVAASAPNSTTMPPAASVPAPGASSAPSPVIPSPSAKASPVARVVPLAPVESTSNVDSLGNPSSNNAASSHPSPPPSPLNQTQKPTASENNSNTGGNSNPQGTIILPCRARGMPVDHNFRTAHFVIPGNIRHGEDLICSYHACRDAGIKFRYCASCRVPVAKRNFYQRHSHGLSVTAEGDSTAAAATPGISTSAYTGKGNSKSLSLPSSRNNDGVTNLGAAAFEASSPTKISRHRHNDSSVEQYQAQQVSNTMSENRSKNKQQRVSSRNGDTARKKSSQSDSIVLTTRQKRWAALLTKRPDSNDDDGISAWLLEIMAVSDRKTPLKNTSTSSLTGSHTSVSSDTREPTSSVNSLSSLDADEILSSGDEGDTSSERHQQRPRDRRRSKKRAKKKKQRTLPLQPETSQRSSKKDGWEDEQDENKRKNKKSKSKRKTKDSSKSKREKRKRKSGDDEVNSIEGHELSGSYAEWRDRKKQKAMSKNKRHGGTSS